MTWVLAHHLIQVIPHGGDGWSQGIGPNQHWVPCFKGIELIKNTEFLSAIQCLW